MAFILPVRIASNVRDVGADHAVGLGALVRHGHVALADLQVPVLGALAVGDVEAHRARHALEHRLMLLGEPA